MQGHGHEECIILHPELSKKEAINIDNANANNESIKREGKQIQSAEKQPTVKPFPTRFLSSGRVVGVPKMWNDVKDNRIKNIAGGNEDKSTTEFRQSTCLRH